MPSGKTHLKIELILMPLCTFFFYLTLSPQWNDIGLFTFTYLISSLWLSPDLDLSKNSARRRWGNASWLWELYSRVCKHRGLSHHLFWGPLTRLAYLGLILGAVLLILSATGIKPPPELLQLVDSKYLLIALLGLYIPNIIHVFLDNLANVRLQIRQHKQKQRHVQHVRD